MNNSRGSDGLNKQSWFADLPSHLQERCRMVSDGGSATNAEFVLYWMRTALRAEENPALDVARMIASEFNLPVLIYHGLSQRYEYASDRHHTFICEGTRDLQQQFSELGIQYAFHLERPGFDGDYLKQLAERATVVVTEDMPTHAPERFLRALSRGSRAPIVAVDTACVVPMNIVGQAFDRAFAFRNKTKKALASRLSQAWPDVAKSRQQSAPISLPFEPVDLQSEQIGELVAACEIDHTVGSVVDTQGGSTAGYTRWNAFCADGLRGYAKRRNNVLVDGVSRMSAYLHYGMVSPMRLAREAANFDHAGAEKYLDELLIWRELAYNFCRYRPDHERWSSLPSWAQQTLLEHARDSRSHIYSWEQLARGETDDALWNAAQKSLLIHGELHNNVRMTWGKAVINWTRTPQQALKTIIDLNHRYALDGRDPASYGGILWCLGQFDRPFQPELPVFGTVRPRPTHIHAQRLNPAEYSRRTSVSRCDAPPHVAVIGAGLSGAMAARTLADHGLPVTVFEKSRSAGGRMATRRNEVANFDHGAQYFTARDKRFKRYVESWIESGVVAEWLGEVVSFERPGESRPAGKATRYVGLPSMNAIAKHIAADSHLVTDTEVSQVHRAGDRLSLISKSGEELGVFDRVVVSAPALQSAAILADFSELADAIRLVEMKPCWAVMARLPRQLECEWSGAFVNFGPLRWIARNGTKPGRNDQVENLVMHAGPEWSTEHLEEDCNQVAEQLLTAFWDVTGLPSQSVEHLQAHRWRYSIPANAAEQRCLVSDDRRVVACGDWAGGPRVEGAFLSGCAAAGRILGTLPAVLPSGNPQLSLF